MIKRVHFLDVGINVESSCYNTMVFRKPTFKAIYIKKASYNPKQYKLAVFHVLFRRALTHCSTKESKDDEVKIIIR